MTQQPFKQSDSRLETQPELIYDSNCPFCRWFIKQVKPEKVVLKPIPNPAQIELRWQNHRLQGAQAVFWLLAQKHPFWKMVAKLLPTCVWEALYRLWARLPWRYGRFWTLENNDRPKNSDNALL